MATAPVAIPLGAAEQPARFSFFPVDEDCTSPECAPQCDFHSQNEDSHVVYSGDMYLHGRTFASGNYFETGEITVRGRRLQALGQFGSTRNSARYTTYGFIDLTKLVLFARVPIMIDSWIRVYKTGITNESSVRGGSVAAPIAFPKYLRPSKQLSAAALRIPCGMLSMSEEPNGSRAINAYPSLLGAGPPLAFSRTPGGESLAVINVNEPLLVQRLQSYLDKSLIMVGDDRTQFVGWVDSARFPSSTRTSFTAKPPHIRSPRNQDAIECQNVDIMVVSRGQTWFVMHLDGHDVLFGAMAPNGDYRVDLGQGEWSKDAGADDGTGPLQPFIPKEQLAHCTRLPAESSTR
jgi:hypothetical protein